jgi:hypothetical protein
VLTFEDLYPGQAAYGTLSSSYGGFTWGGPWGTYWITEDYYPDSGYHNTIVVAPNSRVGILTPLAYDISMSDGAFRLNSMNIGAAWNDDQYVTVAGYLNGNLVGSDYFMAPVTGMTKSFGWGWIDSVEVTPDVNTGTHHDGYNGGYGSHIGLDQIDYTKAPGLPAFMLIGAAPLVGGLVRRYRRK